MKKGQVTLFILVGIGILMIAGIASYMYYSNQTGIIDEEAQEFLGKQVNKENVNSYVTQLLLDIGQDVSKEIAFNGGTFRPQSGKEGVIYGIGEKDRQYISVYSKYETGYGNVNKIIDNNLIRQNIQYEMEREIEKRVKDRLDLSIFEKQAFDVTEGELFNITARMGDDSIALVFTHPVVIERGDVKLEFNNFSANVRVPLGRLYGIAVDLANDESHDGHAYKENTMLSMGGKVRIEKAREYPDTAYVLKEFVPSLEEDMIFRFAIKGKETVVEEVLKYDNKYGCCVNKYDGYVYKNVKEDVCNPEWGEYDSDPECATKRNVAPIVEGCCHVGDQCSLTREDDCQGMGGDFSVADYKCIAFGCDNLDCFDTFSGEIKKHGASWCEYEGRAGSGLDYVGSRHYLHSCIDGVEYIEPCRDYREEMCVYHRGGDDTYPTKAGCRINRWYDCALQTNAADCQDKRYRDCTWGQPYLLLSARKCHPEVPPGFQFWRNQGGDICELATQSRQGSMKKGYVWLDGAFFYCQRMGDCGDKYNVAGTFGKGNWDNKWGKSPAPNYYVPQFTSRGDSAIMRSIYTTDTVADSIPGGRTGSDAWCYTWRATENQCSLCNANPEERPCTEYKCRSLGPGCRFSYEEDGTPVCDTGVHYRLVLPNGSVDPNWVPGGSGSSLGDGGSEGSVEYITYPNITFSDDWNCSGESYGDPLCVYDVRNIDPHEEFGFSFSTEQDTFCTISFDAGNFGSFVEQFMSGFGASARLNEEGMEKNYNIRMRMVDAHLLGADSVQLLIECRNDFVSSNVRVRINMSEDHNRGGVKVVGIEPSSLSTGTSTVIFKTDKPMKKCKYTSGSATKEVECGISGPVSLSSAPITGADPITEILSMSSYGQALDSSNIHKYKYVEGQMMYDRGDDDVFGYYPCYAEVDIESSEICASCTDVDGNYGSEKCFIIE